MQNDFTWIWVCEMKQMKRPRIGPGFHVGRLTVTEATPERKSGYTVWRCACDCGREILLDTRTLQRGAVRDCGCETAVKPGQRDITGLRFGKLVALRPTGAKSSHGGLIWHCKCDCGGEVDAPLHQLTAGYRKSCGCLENPPPQDILGKQFGSLTVIAYDGKRAGSHFWRCRCACGKETVIRQNNLLLGHTQSCGCLQKTVYIDNLKLIDGTSVTLLEAARRQRLISTNTSGCTGVYRNRKSGKWVAQITFKGKTYYLGSFAKIEDAVKARRLAEEQMYDGLLEWYYKEYLQKEKTEEHK